MAKEPSREVAVRPETAEVVGLASIQDDRPAYLAELPKEEVNRGLELLDQQADISMPRIVLCQGLTPQRQRDDPMFIKGLEDGDFFNNVTNQIYGRVLRVTPVMVTKSRIKFTPMKDGGGIECQSFNAIDGGRLSKTCETCPHSQWNSDAENEDDRKPSCTLFMNYIVMLHPTGEIAALSFKITAMKHAKNWNSMMRMRRAPSYAGVYTVKSVGEKNAKGAFYVPVASNDGWADPNVFKAGAQAYEVFAGKTIDVNLADEARTKDVGSADGEM